MKGSDYRCLKRINTGYIRIRNSKNIFQNVLDVYDSSIIVCFQTRLSITKVVIIMIPDKEILQNYIIFILNLLITKNN